MTASSEAEGTISCGGASSTVVAILFYQLFFFGRKRSRCAGGRYGIHVINWSAIRHVILQLPLRDWVVGRMDPELSEVDNRSGD